MASGRPDDHDTQADRPGRAAAQSLHVMLVTDSLEPSGVGQHMLMLAAGLRNDARVTLVFPDTARQLAEQAARAGHAAVVVPAPVLSQGKPELRRLLDELAPDIVHVHAGINYEGHGIAAAACQPGGKRPALVRTEHLPYVIGELNGPGIDVAYAHGIELVDRVICVSHAARCTYRAAGIRGAIFEVVHNGVQPNRACRSAAQVRAELGLRDSPLILTVARFTEQKSHETLLTAMPGVLSACPQARLALVGTGRLQRDLADLARQLGLGDSIRFLGRRDDVADLLAAAQVFCLPSIFEGHPLVVLEAMAAGVPVVATRSIGMTETVRNGATGLLVPRKNPAMLAAALVRLVSDPLLSSALGAAGRAEVSARFSCEAMARQTLRVYRDTLASSGLWRQQVAPNQWALLAAMKKIGKMATDAAGQVPFQSRRERRAGSRPRPGVAPITLGKVEPGSARRASS
jgi:glycosyltransferase involved in cell wall biosynthesis